MRTVKIRKRPVQIVLSDITKAARDEFVWTAVDYNELLQ